jgi:Flp pilus assembly protein TadG
MIFGGCRCGRGGERGSSTVEAVFIVPLFFLVTLLVVQLGLGWLAGNVAQAAARQGLHAASSYEGSIEQGRSQAHGYLDAVAPRLLAGARVDVTRTDASVTVRVHGPVLAILPWPRASTNAQVSGPVERFVAGG